MSGSVSAIFPSRHVGFLPLKTFARGGEAIQPTLNANGNASPLHVAKKMYKAYFMLMPEQFRYLGAGTLGNLTFFLTERMVFDMVVQLSHKLPNIMAKNQESTSFFLSYLLQIVPQHWFNAFLCYGLDTINTKEKYRKTLLGTYSALSFTLLVSTVMNAVLIKLGMQKDHAFATTLFLGAILNYILLTFVVVKKVTPPEKTVEITGEYSLYNSTLDENEVCLEGYDEDTMKKGA
mmetsp:Transcript_20710/g.29247  ORF Transcript_20710/g.29247 Transcript_20710/m.29247 type:complete len:234 (-) Transcript_20710:123-824(-)